MAVHAGGIADVMRSFDLRGSNDGAAKVGTGDEQAAHKGERAQKDQGALRCKPCEAAGHQWF